MYKNNFLIKRTNQSGKSKKIKVTHEELFMLGSKSYIKEIRIIKSNV